MFLADFLTALGIAALSSLLMALLCHHEGLHRLRATLLQSALLCSLLAYIHGSLVCAAVHAYFRLEPCFGDWFRPCSSLVFYMILNLLPKSNGGSLFACRGPGITTQFRSNADRRAR